MIEVMISQSVKDEVEEVTKRLKIHKQKTRHLLNKIRTSTLNLTKKSLLKRYGQFTTDERDSHVVAGAHKTKSKFLLTHNTKHYKIDKIKNEFGIIVLKPGYFLQYLRSLEKL